MDKETKFILGKSNLSSDRTFIIPPDKDQVYFPRIYHHDKLDLIFEDAVNFKNQIDSKFESKPFSCYNFEQNEFDINYDLDCVIEEAVEAKQLLNRKKWKDTRHEIDKEKLLEELIDIDKFLIQAIIRLGYSAKDVYEMHKKKNEKNIKRQENGY